MTIGEEIARRPIGRKDVALWAETGPSCHCLSAGPVNQGLLGVRDGTSAPKAQAELGMPRTS
eukprot:15307203-Alexandrium_andersonii.AAC.1